MVLEFGRYGSNLAAYILVANLLTRRIYGRYQQLTDEAAGGDGSQKPRPLVITIEEAHKFLNSRNCGPDYIRHNRPRDAQVQRHASGGGPASVGHRR